MRRFCLTLVDSATATSKPRPVAARAPAPAIPAFKKSRRVTVGIAARLLTTNGSSLKLSQARICVKFQPVETRRSLRSSGSVLGRRLMRRLIQREITHDEPADSDASIDASYG